MSSVRLTKEEENDRYGRDVKLSISGTVIDIDVSGSGDISLTDGLAQLVLNVVTLLLNTTTNLVTGEGEISWLPDFGSAFRFLILNPIPEEEYLEILQLETINAITTFYGDIVTSAEFSNAYVTADGGMFFEINLTVVGGSLATLGVIV